MNLLVNVIIYFGGTLGPVVLKKRFPGPTVPGLSSVCRAVPWCRDFQPHSSLVHFHREVGVFAPFWPNIQACAKFPVISPISELILGPSRGFQPVFVWPPPDCALGSMITAVGSDALTSPSSGLYRQMLLSMDGCLVNSLAFLMCLLLWLSLHHHI